jgi:hypothetical protein
MTQSNGVKLEPSEDLRVAGTRTRYIWISDSKQSFRNPKNGEGGSVKNLQFSLIAILIAGGVGALKGETSYLNVFEASGIRQDSRTGVHSTTLEPHLDLREYGAYATYSSTSAATTAGSAIVRLATASHFKNNEFITIFNAGHANEAELPTGLTVIPSVNAGGYTQTETVKGGSTKYGYRIVAEDKYRGRTASTAVASTTTAQASLGMQGVNIRTLTRTNNVVTVVCASACNVPVGGMVYIQYFTTNDPTFEGFFKVASVKNSTTFLANQNFDTRLGATSEASAAISTRNIPGCSENKICLAWFNEIRLTWAESKNALRYYIYGSNCPKTCTLIGQTVMTFWDDYGPTMEQNQFFPPFVPTTAPGAGANQHLIAKIVAGGGTTSLTLNVAAGASKSASTALSDDGPAFVAAAYAHYNGQNGITPIYIGPQMNYPIVNSYIDFLDCTNPAVPEPPPHSCGSVDIQLNGNSLDLNDTLALAGSRITGLVGNTAPSFTWVTQPEISGTAYPLLYGGFSLNRVALTSTNGNGGLNAYITRGSNYTFDFSSFVTGNGNSTDYTGMNIIFQTGGFSYRFRNSLISTGSPGGTTENFVGFSPVASIAFIASKQGVATGNFGAESVWFTNRGSMEQSCFPGNGVNWQIFRDIQTQNSYLPILQFTCTDSTLVGNADIEDVTPADFPTALIANYTPGVFTGISIKNTSNQQGSRVFLAGNPFFGVDSNLSLTSGSPREASFSETIVALDGKWYTDATGGGTLGRQTFNKSVRIGNNYTLFTGGPRAPTPSCLVSGSGPVAKGSYEVSLIPVWWSGGEGKASFPVKCDVSSDNSKMKINWTAMPGVMGYDVAVNGRIFFCNVPNFGPQVTSADYPGVGCEMSGNEDVAGPVVMNSDGLQTTRLGLDTLSTHSNCASAASTASCGSAAAGSVAIAAGQTKVTVQTTAVTANSQIILTEDSSLGERLGLVCNRTLGRTYAVTTRTKGRSFVIESSMAPASAPACISFTVLN